MSEFKGTKGEWKINTRASRNVQCNGTTIANCSAGQSGDDEHIEIANAKLIACAPEMLEILDILLKEPRIIEAMILSGENSILNDNIKKAKELIKKETE